MCVCGGCGRGRSAPDSPSWLCTEYKECFSLYDKQQRGKIKATDLMVVMRCLGASPTPGEVQRHLQTHKIGEWAGPRLGKKWAGLVGGPGALQLWSLGRAHLGTDGGCENRSEVKHAGGSRGLQPGAVEACGQVCCASLGFLEPSAHRAAWDVSFLPRFQTPQEM